MARVTRSFALAAAIAGLGALLSAQPRVPTPASVIGWEPCADYKLATYEQIEDYFRRVAAAAPDRMRLVEMGKTTEGRTQVLAVVSSEDNIRQLGRYKDIARTLALARDGRRPLTDAEARTLARDGKAVVWIDFGLHSIEVAHAQTAPLLLFKAVTEESDDMRAIRDNVILLLVANMNPDGTTMVASWYREHLGKPWESRLPELWHKYVGHDDNRDWYMMTQLETRNSARLLYTGWFPQIVYNQHQAGPFPSRIFVPPFDDPMNPNIPPLVMRGVNLVGDAMTRRLDQEGIRGAVSRIGFDAWWNGGMRTAPYFHNMVGILTETSHPSATPAHYDPRTFPKFFAGTTVPTLEPTIGYPSPYPGGEWHLRDSCNIMVTTSMAALDIAAKRRQEWLFDIYQMGRDAIRANARETFVIPAEQWDPGTAVKLVNVLRLGAIEVERATVPFSAGGAQYGAGSFVIRGAQPFEPYAKDLLTPQVYPDMRLYPGGPPKRPYDITGWTLSYQMGVHIDRVSEAVNAATEIVDVAAVPAVPVPPAARIYAIDPRSNDSFIAVNRLLEAGEAVSRTASAMMVGGGEWPAGTFIVAAGSGTNARIEQIVRSLGVRIAPLPDRDAAPIAPAPAGDLVSTRLRTPRIALYHGWGGNMDEGWTRWLLEQFEFPYASLFDRDVRAGNLRARFDVILLPDATYEQMVNGMASGTMPDAYTGGMTARGVSNLREFVSQGGTLVAMDRAAELPLTAFNLPIRNVTASTRDSDFYVPGSILKIVVDPTQPVAYGMPREAAAFFINSPAFAMGRSGATPDVSSTVEPAVPESMHIVARYPENGLLMSGWMLGERVIAGRAAVIDAAVDKGHVVLLGFRSGHRGQTHGTYKLLFNSIFLGASERQTAERR
ncbi:MAG TPA: M14 metallopeptidase family protein [Vicinamibacterales bacterium]|nr:M14 metallopeptidase family protein [Vicinamibacterales bacterium]